MLRSAASYPLRHWRGEFRLTVSFWISPILGALALVLVALALKLAQGIGSDPLRHVIASAGLTLAFAAVVVWHIVGIWRSAARHRGRGGRRIVAIAARAVTVPWLAFAALIVVQGSLQMREQARIVTGDPDIPPFEIRVLAGGTEIEFYGGIRYGAAAAFQQAIEANPRIHTVHLNSTGGRPPEATRMRDVIRVHRFDTYTATGCFSACTIAFLGGKQRFVNPMAELGFHATASNVGPAKATEQVNELIRQEIIRFGVDADFARRAIATPHAELWRPSITDLVRSGYASAASEGQFAISGLGPDRSREAIGELLRKTSLFDAVAQAAPEVFEAMIDIFLAGLAEGTPEGMVHARVQQPLSGLITRQIGAAGDDAVLAFGRLIVEQLTLLDAVSGDDCHALLFPDPAAPNRAIRHFDAAMRLREAAVTEAVIRSGAGRPPIVTDPGEFAGLMQDVAEAIADAHGPVALEQLGEIDSPAMGKAEVCKLTMMLYGAILDLPPADSAKVLRRLLSSG